MHQLLHVGLLSFTAVATIGPTNLLAIKEGLKDHGKSTLLIIAGGAVGEAFYATLASLGLSAIGDNVYFKAILGLIGASFFFYLGISNLKKALTNGKIKINTHSVFKKMPPYLVGMLITLANPLVIIFWATAYSSLGVDFSLFIPLVIVGVGLAWASTGALIIYCIRNHFKEKHLKKLEFIVGIILIFFGFKFSHALIQGWIAS